ncbi:unnamed protein product [Cercospora beticola]|nr:unnamed protein product [Cercospora beticola]
MHLCFEKVKTGSLRPGAAPEESVSVLGPSRRTREAQKQSPAHRDHNAAASAYPDCSLSCARLLIYPGQLSTMPPGATSHAREPAHPKKCVPVNVSIWMHRLIESQR